MIKQWTALGWVLTATLLTTGCSTLKQYDNIQVGQSFVLNQPLNIPAGSTRTYIQAGETLGGAGFNHSEQHCRIEVRTLSENKQIVQPDVFKINAIQIDEEMIASKFVPQIQLALSETVMSDALNQTHLVVAESSYERLETMDLVHFNLTSSKQPDVMRLTCSGSLSNGNLMDAPRSYRPDFNQIKVILGDIGYIK